MRGLWVRYWNASGHYEKNGKVYRDGVSYDGLFLYNSRIVYDKEKEKRFYFMGTLSAYKGKKDILNRPEKRFFYEHQVVNDPRLTNWWMFFAGNEHKSLFEVVRSGIFDENNKHTETVNAIINDMVLSGIVKKEELKNMSSNRIKEVITDYTNIALTYNLQKTRREMKKIGDIITKDIFMNFKEGDIIQDFYWFRFGPYPVYREEYQITKISGKGINKKINLLIKETKEPHEVGWEDFFEYQKWMILVKK